MKLEGVRCMNWSIGFSYVGLFFLFMLYIPNIIWSKYKPKDYDIFMKTENKVLVIFEKIGEVLVTCVSLIFTDFNINAINYWSIVLLLAFLVMLLYEIYWIKYFRSEKTMQDMYSSLLGIPVAGATLSVFAFLLLGIYGRNIVMILSVILLGIGHIGISLGHRKQIQIGGKI